MQNTDGGPCPPTRRSEILGAAADLFLAKGYAATSMSALAAVCGVRKASLYHHFPSKEALFVACVTDGYEDAVRALEAIRDDATLTDEARMRRVFTELYRIMIDSPTGRMSPLIAEVSRRIPDVARAFHDGFIHQQHQIVNEILDAGVAAGAFAQHDRLGIEHLIFGPIVTLSLSREMFASFDTLDTLFPADRIRQSHCDLVLQLLTQGGGTAPAPRP
jgi:AcrR family transcriptional regulator